MYMPHLGALDRRLGLGVARAEHRDELVVLELGVAVLVRLVEVVGLDLHVRLELAAPEALRVGLVGRRRGGAVLALLEAGPHVARLPAQQLVELAKLDRARLVRVEDVEGLVDDADGEVWADCLPRGAPLRLVDPARAVRVELAEEVEDSHLVRTYVSR